MGFDCISSRSMPFYLLSGQDMASDGFLPIA